MVWPAVNGPEVTSVFTSETSAEATAVPPLPVLSVLFERSGSNSAGVAVARLSKGPAAVMGGRTGFVVLGPPGRPAGGPGQGAPPPPVAFGMVRVLGGAVGP